MGHLNDMYGADDMSAVGAAIEARKREREASAAKDEAFGPVELLVGPNPNSRGQADKDRAGIVEAACKAFAKNEISGNQFELRIAEARAKSLDPRELVPDSLDPRELVPDSIPPSARYCSCASCVHARRLKAEGAPAIRKLVTDDNVVIDPNKEHRVVMHPVAAAEIMAADDRKLGIGGAPTRATTLPTDAAGRKEYPVASGFMDYFPDAIAAVSNLSKKGNDQHNPGQPLHWARGKSGDESDTMMRHFLQRGTLDTDGIRHTVKMAWRAMAILQKEIEGEK